MKKYRTGLLLVIVAAVTLEVTAVIQMYFSQKGIKAEASLRAESELEATQCEILDVIDQAESAVKNNVWIACWALDNPDSLSAVCRRLIENNPVVMGSTVALVPGYLRSLPLYAPYVFRDPSGALTIRSLATEEYDYPAQEWFAKPLESGEGYWSEPYLDEGGGDILMTTYSAPVRDASGKIAAILTADISLDWLSDMVGGIKVYPHAFSLMVSRTGQIMVCPAETLVMRRTVDEIANRSGDSASIRLVNQAMRSGTSGNLPVKYKGSKNYVYFAPVERTGWSMSIVIPESDIYGTLRRIGGLIWILQILGLAMIVLIIRSYDRSQTKYKALSEKKERMENELHIASGIQMAMIPKIFPPFPDRNDLDMSAAIIPAKEVGGDLYDFYIREGKLFFCIGDVSGKGIPASLVMAVTRTTFRNISAHQDDPALIVTMMNASLSESNENCMFVTFFCGVLDLENGRLRYCNAGHNPPMILLDTIHPIEVDANIPLGVVADFQFSGQETTLRPDSAIFLYTDGLTEAENLAHEQFGETRIESALHGWRCAEEHLRNISDRVIEFVGEAPQSDDLTMLFIHYLGKENPHRIILRNNIKQISRLEGWVEGIAGEAGLDLPTTMNVNLALEEAVTNVILYAYPEGMHAPVILTADLSPTAVTFTLSDNGTPFDPTAAPEVDIDAPATERPIGGLGIHLVRKIMDTVAYRHRDGKNILTMTKNIK